LACGELFELRFVSGASAASFTKYYRVGAWVKVSLHQPFGHEGHQGLVELFLR
jgi:hypothetical protein